jgi:hypothetical protein
MILSRLRAEVAVTAMARAIMTDVLNILNQDVRAVEEKMLG